MSEIFDELYQASVWEEYLRYKTENRHLTRSGEKDLTRYISGREYLPVLVRLNAGESFSYPEKKMIRKVHTAKKRVVYTYSREENYVLKLLTYQLLRKYDGIFSADLYSFRVNSGIHKAMDRILKTPGIRNMYTYKADISNYFNSIDVDIMCADLDALLTDDPKTVSILKALLKDPYVLEKGNVIREEKGVMAGTPPAVFLANVYLSGMDRYFEEQGILYARYSDDIIIFAETEEKCRAGEEKIRLFLQERKLSINPEKEVRTKPGEAWTFLGIQYRGGEIDVSPVAKDKLKAKIRRKARGLRRWQARKGAADMQTVRAFIRSMNRKFFDYSDQHELTWTRWYFPLINTDRTLKEIDHYMQDWVRYLGTGSHADKRYRMRYEEICEQGFVSLVNAWYRYRENRQQDDQRMRGEERHS